MGVAWFAATTGPAVVGARDAWLTCLGLGSALCAMAAAPCLQGPKDTLEYRLFFQQGGEHQYAPSICMCIPEHARCTP